MRVGPAIAGLMVLGLGGCSKDPKLVPVTGTVTLDKKPLSGALVTFVPMGSTPGTGSFGRTKADGTYQLVAYRGGAGAVAGQYKVTISKRVMADGSDLPENSEVPPIEAQARETLPQYSDADQTTLTATVPPAGGTIDFPLKKARGSR